MAFNNSLKDVASKFSKVEIVSRDWWLYILNELSGGYTYFDKNSFILYRQHKNSLIGSNTGLLDKSKRLVLLLKGRFRSYNDIHLISLSAVSMKQTNPWAVRIIDYFFNDRHKGLVIRLRMLRDLKLYRQTWDDEVALYIAMILKRL
jgi:hypothetical protein